MSPAFKTRRRLVDQDQVLALQSPPKAPLLEHLPVEDGLSSIKEGREVADRPSKELLLGLDLLNHIQGPAEFVYDQHNDVYTFKKLC